MSGIDILSSLGMFMPLFYFIVFFLISWIPVALLNQSLKTVTMTNTMCSSSSTPPSEVTTNLVLVFIFFLMFYLFIFRREEEMEKEEGEKHQCARDTLICYLLCAPNWGPGPQPRHVPWPESNPQPFGSQAGTESTKPHQPGLSLVFVILLLFKEFPSHFYHTLALTFYEEFLRLYFYSTGYC